MSSPTHYLHTTNVHNTQAAAEIVPYIIELFKPVSVADVGCGLGSWLKVFQDNGIADVTGFDGQYVDASKLFVDSSHFKAMDLELPLQVKRKFDLVISLEVAEHLKPDAASTFVNSLVALSDTIIFSAAIPGQGGQNHLNERWPSWWAGIFEKHDYFFYDIFRNKFWDNSKIDWWYRQNIFLVTIPEIALSHGFQKSSHAFIHPELYEKKIRKIEDFEKGRISLSRALVILGKSFIRAIRKRINLY